ncbi:ShlB/FhaC/HecB family hemolysin secretion/activation protein [Shimwellia blattae]|uniref:Putative hemolysin secretion/activation protein n=1 Tax=Shimwellia blattae (strain ATCC 29907 / DSM 4481 / JCM 1650 / NBRC 105725 / CDC 9005-74) TaxID=630626 RepID=I2B6B8_SHIBC|nr:putative hemolysin secretion/activation protein [Shimwellia blattae DSM 4481 = NBRC 105725]GAB82647.1 putative hemolysin activation protein [Shimwellia blattae DSM 4481 = NBRC 105725]VDY63546.1 Hemolysin transporter protein shlB precursor [Shimwellia blattae]VEC21547.1 Hemolysin transporter protein shlB precursor [Shimwellia blattae]
MLILIRIIHLCRLSGALVLFPFFTAGAKDLPARDLFNQQQQQIEARQSALEAWLAPLAPDITAGIAPADTGSGQFVTESPCFMVHEVVLTGREDFPSWFPARRIADTGAGHCLGIRGINQLMSRIQDRMISHGWVTSRVLAPQQDLRSGRLTLHLLAGRINSIRYGHGSDEGASLTGALPLRPGERLDLRAIEQGLENLQRLPGVSARVDISPASAPGESDIIITRQQTDRWRLSSWIDNTGSQATGRYPVGVALALDNPLALSDLFWLSASRDSGFAGKKGSQSLSSYYSLPFGFWQFSLSGNASTYARTLTQRYGDIRYSGNTRNFNLGVSRVIQRNATGKTTLRYSVLWRENRNYINDQEVDVQRRRTSAWQAGLDHRHFLGPLTLDAGISWQRGTRWFGGLPAYETYASGRDYATDKSKILTWQATASWPFQLLNQSFHYQASYLRQTSTTPLTVPDQFAIGNRWTVRGFDGERLLSASNGWYLRNTLAWSTPVPGQQLYLGIDSGGVSGYGADRQGRHLAGSALGLRGELSALNLRYDLFAGHPLSRPGNFPADPLTFGFSVGWQY